MLKRNKKWLKVIRISKNDSIFATGKLRLGLTEVADSGSLAQYWQS